MMLFQLVGSSIAFVPRQLYLTYSKKFTKTQSNRRSILNSFGTIVGDLGSFHRKF